MLGIPSLSAGAWYVSIDFQLFALLAIGAAALHRKAAQPVWRSPLPWAVAALTLASLAWFNRDGAFDAWASYFPGQSPAVYIQTSERTALEFLLEPLTAGLRCSFREH